MGLLLLLLLLPPPPSPLRLFGQRPCHGQRLRLCASLEKEIARAPRPHPGAVTCAYQGQQQHLIAER